jgi:5-formyltetrahydrofolate cyclo-ligase
MKEKIRKDLIEKRSKLPKRKVLERSKKISDKFFNLKEFNKATNIFFYVSYDNEVNTHNMIKKCLSLGKNVVVPICDAEDSSMSLSKIEKWSDLEPGSFNILEPKMDKIREVTIYDIDLTIIPGIGFDEQGFRLGHGFGYYDKLLKDSTNAINIGLAFEIQIVEKIPIETHDLPVDLIITEKRVIKCIET